MEKQKLVNFLNQLLSNYFVMYVKLHRYHWYIQGKHFFQLHETFKEMYTMFASDLDKVAERILMIQGQPFATMSKYLKEATLEEATADDQEDEIITQLLKDYQQIITEIHKTGTTYAADLNDEPTVDMLITMQGQLEKYVWMLSAYRELK